VGTFLPMSKKLQKHLASLELTKPGHRTGEGENVDAEGSEPTDAVSPVEDVAH